MLRGRGNAPLPLKDFRISFAVSGNSPTISIHVYQIPTTYVENADITRYVYQLHVCSLPSLLKFFMPTGNVARSKADSEESSISSSKKSVTSFVVDGRKGKPPIFT